VNDAHKQNKRQCMSKRTRIEEERIGDGFVWAAVWLHANERLPQADSVIVCPALGQTRFWPTT
jgi:hypothetical protein